jgi:hypothetical protein
LDNQENGGHSSGIIQVDCLDNSEEFQKSSSFTQFVSLDAGGEIIFWVTNEIRQGSTVSDLSLREGAVVMLLQTRKISSKSFLFNEFKLSRDLFCLVPQDSSSIMISSCEEVHRLARHGQLFNPNIFGGGSNFVELNSSHRYVTALIAVSNLGEGLPQLLFVGRSNGTLDLYRIDEPVSIFSWNLQGLASDSKAKQDQFSVTYLQWLSRYSVVLAVTASGLLFEFDFSMDFLKPSRQVQLNTSAPLEYGDIAITETRLNSEIKFGMVQQKSKGNFQVCTLNYMKMVTNAKTPKELKKWLQNQNFSR